MHFDLSEKEQRSIVLKPLLVLPTGFSRKTKNARTLVSLKVSLSDDPTGRQLAEWLMSFAPHSIQEVEIEKLVFKARELESLSNESPSQESILKNFSKTAQAGVMQRVWNLSRAVSSAASAASLAYGTGEEQLKSATRTMNTEFAGKAIQDITKGVSSVCAIIEEGIVLSPEIDLDAAAQDKLAVAANVRDTIKLRQFLVSSQAPDPLELIRSKVKLETHLNAQGAPRFRYGRTAEGPVFVESFQYEGQGGSPGSLEASPQTANQLKRMVTQLQHPKHSSFRTLPCVGYFQELHARSYTIVFSLDARYRAKDRPVSLYTLIMSKKYVPLEVRAQIGHKLAVALGSFHRVGWVHKEFKSENILFFRLLEVLVGQCSLQCADLGDDDIDIANPWLFGFEFSRPQDALTDLQPDFSIENNRYRHPERWGHPRIKFEKYHDVYSLVSHR